MMNFASAGGSGRAAGAVSPLRNWVLAGLGALAALAIQQLSYAGNFGEEWQRRLVGSLPAFIGVTALAFGLAWRPRRLALAIVIAVICGIIAGGVFLWNGLPDGGPSGGLWQLFCGGIAAAALLTLFQAAQDRSLAGAAPARPAGVSPRSLREWSREAIHYEDVHGHLWTNTLLIGACCLFMLLTFGIAHLLASMFMLVKLDFLRDALREEAVVALLLGAAFGGALGLLQDRGGIISALQRVVMLVLRILAPVLAVGIGVFLAALPVTGLAPLWETGGTTPIMLMGAILALLLANAVVGDQPEEESRSVVLGASAAALGVFLLPLVGIAVYSSGLRIHQHGLSPERLWALAFLVVGSITAIGYLVAILGARGWFERLRRTNLTLVYLVAGIALLLSTPIFGFDRIATQHQLSRLARGQVAPENFDYRALWFDFGPAGRAAIRRLAAGSSDTTVRRLAGEASKLTDRWSEPASVLAARAGDSLDRRLTVLPDGAALSLSLRRRLVEYDACGATGECVVHYAPNDGVAVVLAMPQSDCRDCAPSVRLLTEEKGIWSESAQYLAEGDAARTMAEQVRNGQIEVRPVTRRQIFVGEKPIGSAFSFADDTTSQVDAP